MAKKTWMFVTYLTGDSIQERAVEVIYTCLLEIKVTSRGWIKWYEIFFSTDSELWMLPTSEMNKGFSMKFWYVLIDLTRISDDF